MSPTKATIITGKRIEIKGSLRRHEIVKKVVNHFIETEHAQKGTGIKFQYPVEDLPDGDKLMIGRPGLKKNFDFKVIVEPLFGLERGQHQGMANDIRAKRQANPQGFDELWDVITQLYHCLENDVEVLLASHRRLRGAFETGADIETVLKVMKWFFIMEDIFYWDSEGRAFLYNYLNYVAREDDVERLEKARADVKAHPANLKRYIKKCGLEWIRSKG